jgi:hypothetical protein
MQRLRSANREPLFQLLGSLAFVGAFVALLCVFFNPKWESNDDVAMSMVAHGYGLAVYGSPHLIFSNVTWGHIVRALPTIHGVLGYSVATVGTIVFAGTAIAYFLVRMGAGYLTSAVVVSLILLRPTLFPQFTINAGLLTCAAVLGWLAHARDRSRFCLVTSTILAFLAYLVRNVEFALVLFIALPFLPWRALKAERQTQIAFGLLAIAILAATCFDYWSYRGADWDLFWEFNRARAPFTDFGAANRLLARPDVMAAHGLSHNDVVLISRWFFVDRFANPQLLSAVLSEIGTSSAAVRFDSIRNAVESFGRPELLPMSLAAAVLLVLRFDRRLLLSWLLCLAAVIAMALAGRPGIFRVYLPLSILLVVLPIACGPSMPRLKHAVVLVILAIASWASGYGTVETAKAYGPRIAEAQSDRFSTQESVVNWGSGFPFEEAFSVLVTNPTLMKLKMFGLGGFTLAPFGVAAAEEKAGAGLVSRLRSAKGILISTNEGSLQLLGNYCSEKYGAAIEAVVIHKTELWTVYNVRCNAPLNAK